MLVIIIFLLFIFCSYMAICRKSTISLICAVINFLLIFTLQVVAPTEEKIVDQKQMLGLIIDPFDYVSYCSDYADYRIVTEEDGMDDYGWEELRTHNFSIVFEENDTNPIAIYYSPKTIGLLRVNLIPYERVEFHIPPNTTYYLSN